MKKLNNKGMSIVEIVLTFALIMMITTGLLMIVVNYRNKVTVSSERLTMDTFKNNITQDLYSDMLKYGLKEINEYIDIDNVMVDNVTELVKSELKANPTYQVISDNTFNSEFNAAVTMVKNDLRNAEVKSYTGSGYKNTFAQALITKYVEKYGECLTLTDLNRCINITFQNEYASGKNAKAFGTSKVVNNSRESLENKFLYYDGIRYKIADKLPSVIPKDANGNERALTELQRIKLSDEGILEVDSAVLEDGTKLDIYSINVRVYHVDFKEDFGIHLVMSTDDVSL